MHPSSERAILISLTAAIAGGLLLIILARRTKLPAIVLLLFGGVAFGPEGLGLVQPESLQGFLPVIVSLAIGLILFEGGLTLDLRGFSNGSNAITGLLTIGVLVTWLGTAVAARWCFDVTWPLALLAGSMVIVTGPTVIGPLLKRLQIEPRLHNILHWEGVLIDAIGVFVATLCFEWIAGHSGRVAVGNFGLRALSGAAMGLAGGFAIVLAFRRRWVPQNLLNAFALAAAVFIFGATEAIISHAGLLAVTVAGFIVGWRRPVELDQIRHFKAEITDLLIGMLFLLLASRLKLEQFHDFGWRGILLVAIIMLIVRPLNVLLSTLGASLSWREKAFLSWIAPRGIVAASLASLFAIALAAQPSAGAAAALPGGNGRFLETFVYSVIVATVVLQGFSAGWVARLLHVKRPDPTGWMIVNADAFGRRLARFIKEEAKLDVLLLDTNARLIAEARAEGLPALCENALDIDLAADRDEFQPVGHLLALTDNAELNELLCNRWGHIIGHEGTYRWSPARNGAAPETTSGHGRVVFAKMARPSVISAELLLQETRIEIAADDAVTPEGLRLLTLAGGEILPAVSEDDATAAIPVDGSTLAAAGRRVLVLARREGFLSRSVAAGGVVDIAAGTLTDLYRQLVGYVVERNPGVSREQLLRDTLEPNELVPAWLGHGIAVPHLYSSHLSHRVCVLARLAQPGLHVPEQDALRFVFFLVSPAGDPEGHLATLAEIARFCSNPAHREALAGFSAVTDAERFVRSQSR
jgi:NhaP-type Na+/H+ or K+/H+ antiporter/mannitol/fructose-specific phosphotransferase system IIA component (Ntr-type)